jgi:diadenosine tetraphosphate (Ap4A) HIT family hydrolase
LLGRSYITLKRHASELDELTPAEDEAFTVVRNGLFKAIRASFHPITFNTTCLKNDAFKADPDNTPSEAAHVHWHVLPRYGTEPVSFAGESFTDPEPGRYLHGTPKKSVSHGTALAIATLIRSNL